MTKSLNILLLEDNLNDAQLIYWQVVKSGLVFNWTHVSSLIAFVESVHHSKPDIVLSDYNLMSFTGLDALEIVKQKCPLVPFIIVTGNLDEETAAETIKLGAWDYILKDRLVRLDIVIKNALELKKEKEEKALALEKLKKSEERFSLAVDGTMEGIWDQDLKTGECYYSPRYKSMLGFDVQDFDDNCSSWINLIHLEDKEATLLAFHKHLNGEIPQYQAEFRMKCKDGSYRWILGLGKAIYDNSGKACRISGSHKDISERKKIEIELIHAKDKAEESSRLKTAFLHNISHEIRTPMNAIQGYSDLLNKRILTEVNKLQFTEIINASGKQLLHIVDDLLDISKIESNQLELFIETVRLKPIVDQLIENQLQSKLYTDNPQVELQFSFPNDFKEYSLKTDPKRFVQICDNLIINSLKYTDKGFVEFGCKIVKTTGNDEIEFYIKDTGVGIQELDKEFIFEPFRQADDKSFKEGTGLGLSITKALVELLGGKIWFQSSKDVGSSFFFKFPCFKNRTEIYIEPIKHKHYSTHI